MPEEQIHVIPLVEEHVSTTKREVETGRVRVRVRVERREDWVRTDLARDEVDIARVPIGREIDAVPGIRQDGDTTIVPVVEEVLVVEKRLMLVEEIHLRRRHGTETVETPVTLARQHAEIIREAIAEESPLAP